MTMLDDLRRLEEAAEIEVMYLEAGEFTYVLGYGKALEAARNKLRAIRLDIEELTERGAT